MSSKRKLSGGDDARLNDGLLTPQLLSVPVELLSRTTTALQVHVIRASHTAFAFMCKDIAALLDCPGNALGNFLRRRGIATESEKANWAKINLNYKWLSGAGLMKLIKARQGTSEHSIDFKRCQWMQKCLLNNLPEDELGDWDAFESGTEGPLASGALSAF